MQRWHTEKILKTYAFEAFEGIKLLIDQIDNYYMIEQESFFQIFNAFPLPLQEFLRVNNFVAEWKTVVSNSASLQAFRNRFFRWFNAFKVIQYLNFASNHIYKKAEVAIAAKSLAHKLGFQKVSEDITDLLEFYRHLDRTGFGIQCSNRKI